MLKQILKPFRLIDTGIEYFSKIGLLISVSTMLIISVLSIILRWMDSGFTWADPLCRHLVFIATFFGGALATGRGTHIAIDIVSKVLETKELTKLKSTLDGLIALLSSIVLVWLAYASVEFVKVELQYGKAEFWGIHSGVLVAIIPTGMLLIAYRFFYTFLSNMIGEDDSIILGGE